MKGRVTKRHLVLLILIGVSAACGKHKQDFSVPQYSHLVNNGNDPLYRFAIHPLYNPDLLTLSDNLLINYLNIHVKRYSNDPFRKGDIPCLFLFQAWITI